MHVLVTGANGFIGSWLLQGLSSLPKVTVSGIDVRVSPWHADLPIRILDVTDQAGVARMLREVKPEVIILNGAVKQLEHCERNRRALAVNVFAQEAFLEYALERGALTVFVSSDMVFGGCTRPPFNESCPVASNNAYGAMKIVGEQLVRTLPYWAIVRTALVYGPMLAPERRALLPLLSEETLTNQSHLIHWSVVRSAVGLPVSLADNLFCTPTFVGDVADGVVRIVARRLTGVFHCAGPERISRAELGRRAAIHGGRPDAVVPFQAATDGIRPTDVSLDSRWTSAALGLTSTPIDEGLRRSLLDAGAAQA